jgi:hypothetical protein
MYLHFVQHRYDNSGAACASWYYDHGKDRKIDLDKICYTLEIARRGKNPERLGCMHRAPIGEGIVTAGDPTAVGSWPTPVNESTPPPPLAGITAQAPLYSGLKDLKDITTIYNSIGMEFYAAAAQFWYNCQTLTAELSPEREACYEQAFDTAFGFDAMPLKVMLQMVQVCTEDCNACRCLGYFRPEIFHAFHWTNPQMWISRPKPLLRTRIMLGLTACLRMISLISRAIRTS